jgi:mannose-6-phosphate isomerase-like protein (cupin superfamily)
MAGDGWQFMLMRGSPVLGFGPDYLFEPRGSEVAHHHDYTTEVYVCLNGGMELEVDGRQEFVSPNEAYVVEPGIVHNMNRFTSAPYVGITLQIPSLPGDRVEHK